MGAADQVEHGLVIDALDLVFRVMENEMLLELLSRIEFLLADVAWVEITTLEPCIFRVKFVAALLVPLQITSAIKGLMTDATLKDFGSTAASGHVFVLMEVRPVDPPQIYKVGVLRLGSVT